MMILSAKVSRKTEERIRERVAANLCLNDDNPIHRNGVCRKCDCEIEKVCSEMSPDKAAEYKAKLIRNGRLLQPYGIREYKRPVSILRKLAE